jgi:prepilin-type N-terminal cleavage/methylation domain-containing protein
MNRLDPKGFTLVELLVVAILGGVIIAATYQTLVTSQRTFTVQNAQIQGHQTIRAGMDVLFGELREISTPGGDLLSIDRDSVTIRTMRAFGLACDTASAGAPQVTVKRVGRWFSVGDSVFALIDGNPEVHDDDDWRSVRVTAVDTTATCGTGTEQAQQLTVAGLAGGDRVLPGAPLRSYERYTYGVTRFGGTPFLGRRQPGQWSQPIVGPLDPVAEQPVEFVYLDENGTITADPGEVAQIQVTLRTRSPVRDAQGELIRDSMTVRVNTRN